MKKSLLPLNIQFFAEGDQGQGDQGNQQQQQQQQQQTAAPAIDYEKLANLVTGKQNVAEEQVLKGYFKQQGLSQEEMDKAIKSFKDEKAKNSPDVAALQTQITELQSKADTSEINSIATVEAVGLEIDSKTIPYVIKMADLSNVKGQDGKVDKEAVKKALNKVLEDIPGLKPAQQNNNNQSAPGFRIGGITPAANTSENKTVSMKDAIASHYQKK